MWLGCGTGVLRRDVTKVEFVLIRFVWLRRLALAVVVPLGLSVLPLSAQEATPTTDPVAAAPAAQSGPVEVYAGAYVLRLTNVSPRDGSFDVDMWVWFRWKGNATAIDPVNSFELANGVINNRVPTAPVMDGDYNYVSARVQATLYHQFDVRRFPMDNHLIQLDFEDSALTEAQMVYLADSGSALDPGVSVAGWAVTLESPKVVSHLYETDYGMHAAGEAASSYSRLVLPIELNRTSYGVLFKSFWISLLSVVLGLLAFLVKADDLDARFGMGVGSIFAASANSFVISDSLPQTTAVTLAEQINLIAVGIIFVSVFISIWSLRLRYKGRDEASIALDHRAMLVLGLVYVALNILVLSVDLS